MRLPWSLAAAALAVVATAAVADADLKPWKGAATPRLAGADLQGKPFDLERLRGRVVVVNFWATWCEPCRDELPSLERLQRLRAGTPFDVVTVNFGEQTERIKTFLEREFVELPVVLDRDKEAAGRWKVGGLPMTFIVDARGRVRYQVFGERKWDDAASLAVVDKLLAEAPRARR
jgi:cytochrome c biogenesis protein CcmG, thiol:disulfide interchange protein DsbE